MNDIFTPLGIRGSVPDELNCDTALALGRAAVSAVHTGGKPGFIVGKDPRRSSDILSGALAAGLLSAGADVKDLCVVPAAAVPFIVRNENASGGFMITDDGNPLTENGIRIFWSEGTAPPDDVMEKLEKSVKYSRETLALNDKSGDKAGRLICDKAAANDYLRWVCHDSDNSLAGFTIAVDCANGAVCGAAEKLFGGLGAKVFLLNCEPDGINICRDCGTAHPAAAASFVKERDCDIGIIFDASAQRVIAVDEQGNVCEGDRLLAVIAYDMKQRGLLTADTVVTTVMTNLGFSLFAEENGIRTLTTQEGERYILERMTDGGFALGGDRSGSFFFGGSSLAGDGPAAAIQLLQVMSRSGKPLSELVRVIKRYPRVLVNIKIPPYMKEVWKNIPAIEDIINEGQETLRHRGRVVVRELAEENIIRIMIEGTRFDEINDIAVKIGDVIKKYTN